MIKEKAISLLISIVFVSIVWGLMQFLFPSLRNNDDRIYDISSKIKEKMFEVAPSLYEDYEKDEVIFTFKKSTYKKLSLKAEPQNMEIGIYYFNIANTSDKLIVDWSINDSDVLLINKIMRKEYSRENQTCNWRRII